MKKFNKKLIFGILMFVLVGATFLYLDKPNESKADWWNYDWNYRKALTINHNQVAGDLDNFPVLVSFTDSSLSGHAQADGDDFVFIDSEGKTLSHEIESYASSTGQLIAWVKITELSNTEDTNIYLYYGNASVISGSDSSGVWENNFAGVWHLSDDEISSTTDSTVNDNDGIAYGDASTTPSGKIGGAFQFDADYDYIDVGNGIVLNSGGHTICAWVNMSETQGGTYPAIVSKSNNSRIFWDLYIVNSNRRLGISINNTSNTYIAYKEQGDIATSTFRYLCGTYNGGSGANSVNLYINGTLQSGGTSGGGGTRIIDENAHLWFGSDDRAHHEFGGIIDEIKISTVERSIEWIQTEYNNQNNPELFFTVQDEEVGLGPVGYWSFDEGYGTTAHDESPGGNDGTITGAVWQDESMCVSGKCLYFDGDDDYVNVGIIEALNDTVNDVTFSAWIKKDNISERDVIMSASRENSSNGFALAVENAGIRFTTLSVLDYDSQEIIINQNSWHFVSAVMHSDNSVTFYFDGVEKDTVNYGSSGISNSDDYYYIGATTGFGLPSLLNLYKGYIDEVKIYPYARTADQIKQDYNAGLAGVKTKRGTSASFGSNSENWISEGLVGYWKMDESATTSGAIDSSGNGNDGTYEGTASTTVGKFGKGGIFDGDSDYVAVADNDTFSFIENNYEDKPYSLSFWLNLDDVNTRQILLGKYNDASQREWIVYVYNDSFYAMNYHFNDGSRYVGKKLSSGLTPYQNIWTYITITYDGSEDANGFNVYFNGVELDTDILISGNYVGMYNTGSSFEIGAHSSGSYSLNGRMDEVRVYNRVLSPTEVRHLYEWAPGPVLHLKMDEMEGTTVYDSSGNNYNSLFVNSPVWNRGKYGSALNFTGNGDYIIDDDGENYLNGLSAFTLSVWIKSDLIDTDRGFVTGAVPDQADTPFDLRYDNSGAEGGQNNVIKAGIRVSGVDQVIESSANKQTTDWQQLTLTWSSGNQLALYVNGVLDTPSYNGTAQSGVIDGVTRLLIGHSRTSEGSWDGLVDDVRIYNYVRTQKQILEDMNADRPAIKSTVLDLSFDEGYGDTAYDASGNGNNGTLTPGAGGTTVTSSMWSKDGKVGGAIEFDGVDDYVDLGDMDVIDNAEELSGCAWVNHNNITWDHYIFENMGTDGLRLFMDTSGASESNMYRIIIRESSGSDEAYLETDTNSAIAGEWQYICFVYKENNIAGLRMYVNGEEDVNSPVSTVGVSDIDSGATAFRIGSSGNTMDGTIDEVKIYNYAINIDEVEILYNQGKSIVMGEAQSANNNGTTVTGANTDYCIPGDTATCTPPVLELKMDEMNGGTVYDTSGNGNDGTIYGAIWNPVGKKGSALEFDGVDDYVEFTEFTLAGELTLSAWVNFSDSKNSHTIIARNSAVSTDRFYIYSDSIFYEIANNGATDTGYNLGYNNWYFVTLVRDASDYINIYVDGSNIYTSPSTHSGDSLWEGVGTTDGNYNADGLIDDVRIYDYARTPAQIAYDYNRGKPVAYYKFDECQGSVIHDESGNGNHGTLNLGTSGTTATGTCASSSDSFWYNGVNGKLNNSGSFDGNDDYISITDTTNSIFDLTDQITVSAWVNPSTASGFSATFRTILSKDMHSSQPYGLYWDSLNDEIEFLLNQGATRLTVDYNYDANINNWVNIIAIYDSSNVMIYANGELLGSQGYSIALVVDDEPVRIGWDGDSGSDRYFIGQIDEVKIFNYALTSEQVKNEYSSGAVRFE